jgi:hypothetical protein
MIATGYILIGLDGRPLRGFGGRISVYPAAADAEYVRGIAGQFWPASMLPAAVARVELRMVVGGDDGGGEDLAAKRAAVGGPVSVAAAESLVDLAEKIRVDEDADPQITDAVADETRAAEARQRKMNALFDRAATR